MCKQQFKKLNSFLLSKEEVNYRAQHATYNVVLLISQGWIWE